MALHLSAMIPSCLTVRSAFKIFSQVLQYVYCLPRT